MISTARWNVANMEKSCEGGFANATDLAEYLVRKGMPFRTAHSVAASCVRLALDSGFAKIEDLSLEQMKQCSSLIESDVFSCLSPRACMEGRSVTGGPAPSSTLRQIEILDDFCKGIEN